MWRLLSLLCALLLVASVSGCGCKKKAAKEGGKEAAAGEKSAKGEEGAKAEGGEGGEPAEIPAGTGDIFSESGLHTELALIVLGRPGDKPEARWRKLGDTPGNITAEPGSILRIEVKGDKFGDAEAERFASDFAQATDLQELDLTDSAITDEGLKEIVKLKWLLHLDLTGCVRVTDAGMDTLRGYNQLLSLRLTRCGQITDDGIAQVFRMDTLRLLDLSRCPAITDASMGYIVRMMDLEDLRLQAVPITDAAFADVRKLQNLRRIDLTLCKEITDEGIARLAEVPTLRELDVAGCPGVTDDGIAALRESLPRLEVKR